MFEWLDPLNWLTYRLEREFYQVHYVLHCECREFSPQVSCHSPQDWPVKCVHGSPEPLAWPHAGHYLLGHWSAEKKFKDWKLAICCSRGLQRWRRVWRKSWHLVNRHDMSCAVQRPTKPFVLADLSVDWCRSLEDDWWLGNDVRVQRLRRTLSQNGRCKSCWNWRSCRPQIPRKRNQHETRMDHREEQPLGLRHRWCIKQESRYQELTWYQSEYSVLRKTLLLSQNKAISRLHCKSESVIEWSEFDDSLRVNGEGGRTY